MAGTDRPDIHGTLNNDWKNIHLIGSSNWSIEHCTLIGGLPRGPNRESYDLAYGIYIEGASRNGRITNNGFVRHRKAAICVGPECRNIIESNNENHDNNGEFPGALDVIDESAEGQLTRLSGGIHEVIRRVPNRVAKLQNFIIASHDFRDPSWTTPPGATPVAITGSILGSDGVTPAQVLNFSTSNPGTGMETLSLPIPGLEGKTIILEWFHKIVDMDVGPLGLGYPQLRVVMFRIGTTGANADKTTNDGLHIVGIPGTDWIFNRREWTVPRASLTDERIRLAIAGICLRVRGESACYYPKFERVGAVDRPGHGQALPGLQVLAYGGQAIRVFVAEDSPQVLKLASPFGADQ